MNPHVLQGTLAFVLWSTFASWYYINNINWGNQPQASLEEMVTEESVTGPEVSSIEEDTTEAMEIEPAKVDIQTMLYFELNGTSILNKDALDGFIVKLKELPAADDYVLTVTGYTCDIGSIYYNDSLSKVRASIVADLLLPQLNDRTTLDVMGEGEQNPIAANTSEESRSKNRRVELNLTN